MHERVWAYLAQCLCNKIQILSMSMFYHDDDGGGSDDDDDDDL